MNRASESSTAADGPRAPRPDSLPWRRGPGVHFTCFFSGFGPSSTQWPKQSCRGYDVYDPGKVAYITVGAEAQHAGSLHDTTERANSAQGHDFGSSLSDDERSALVEYLKTL